MCMVGTAITHSTRSDSISSSIRPGSNAGGRTSVPRVATAPSTLMTHPAAWNSGMGLRKTVPGGKPPRSMVSRALLTIPRWCSTAPFGTPVVPEVYWTCAGSSVLTAGRVCAGEPLAVKSAQSVNDTTSRSAGSPSRTSSSSRSSRVPRYSGIRKIPFALDWPRTWASSCARSAGLTVTIVIPASAAANSSMTHSGMLFAQTATRSPGSNRPSRARAACSDCSSSSV